MSPPSAPGLTRRAPLMVAATIPVITFVLWLEGDTALRPHPGFMPAFLTLVLACHLLTSTMLVEHYRAGAGPRLLALSAAYVWSAVCVVAHGLTFPGVFAADGLLGGHEETSPLIWLGWNTGFPLLVGLALAPWPASVRGWFARPDHRARRTLVVHAVTAGSALLFVLFATRWVHLVPDVMTDGDYGGFADRFGGWLFAVALAALVVGVTGVALRGDRGGLETWAVVAVVASCADSFLVLTSESRYTLGWYSARALALTGAVVVLLAMLREVTFLYRQVTEHADGLQESNAALREANRLREHMVAVVSHDMRTPLTGLEGYLEVLGEPGLPPDRVARMIERSRVLTRRLTLMTEDLLAVATTNRGDLSVDPKSLCLADVLAECAAGFPDLDVRISAEPGLRVLGDPLRLQQVLANLVRNAQHYGRPPVVLTAYAEGDTVVIDVCDAGDGVPTDFVPRLFEAYTRAEGTGTHGSGLGLSVVRDLVSAHRGTVSYEARTNTFRIVLPGPPPSGDDRGAAAGTLVSE